MAGLHFCSFPFTFCINFVDRSRYIWRHSTLSHFARFTFPSSIPHSGHLPRKKRKKKKRKNCLRCRCRRFLAKKTPTGKNTWRPHAISTASRFHFYYTPFSFPNLRNQNLYPVLGRDAYRHCKFANSRKKKRTRFPQMAVQVFYMFFFLVSGVVPKENTEKKISEFNLRRFVEGLCFVSYSSIHLLHLRIPQLVKYSVSTKGVQWTRVFLLCYLLRLNEDVFFLNHVCFPEKRDDDLGGNYTRRSYIVKEKEIK